MGNRTRRELRTRSGCRKCRERRVKCPEQHPVCGHCKRLGFTCRYEFKLSWQDVVLSECQDIAPRALPDELLVSIQSWMFLNAEQADFRPSSLPADYDDQLDDPSTQAEECTRNESHALATPPRCISPIRLGQADGFLWSYFNYFMTPQIVIDPSHNPYRHIVLRMAASAQGGPLFQCVLAAAANQLQSIGRGEYRSIMWLHRAKALRLLRTHIDQIASAQEADWGESAGQVIASTVMMTFFEVSAKGATITRHRVDHADWEKISKDCSESWTMHADFARNFLSSRLRRYGSLSAEQESLFHFAATYFVSHDVLAGTGGTCVEAAQMDTELCKSVDNLSVMAITGCSRDLLSLISEITQMGSSVEQSHPRRLSVAIQQRRDDIGRLLHGLRQDVSEEFGSFQSELAIVSEVKRLATILYLYSRIDGAGPHEPHMIRVTSQIMALLPQISLRTHTGLWPLFIVATLGIRPECDEDRKLLLSHLAALLETRQLANVKKARRIIEDVWKARDLRPDEPQGWAILQGRRHGPISLA